MTAAKAIAVSTLIIRIFTLICLFVSVLVLATNEFTVDGFKATFSDIHAYRYVLSVAVIGMAYALLQLPFSIYNVVMEKRLIQNGWLQEFDFYGDKVISAFLGTAVGAGFAVSIEIKRFLDKLFGDSSEDDAAQSKVDDYFNKGNIATTVLLLGFISMFIVSVLSSINRKSGLIADTVTAT